MWAHPTPLGTESISFFWTFNRWFKPYHDFDRAVHVIQQSWTVCSPVCVVTGYGRPAVAWRNPAHYGLVQVCIWRPGQVDSTEIDHPWKTVLKGNIWISQGHSSIKFLSFPLVLHVPVIFVYNKLLNFTRWRLLSGLFICTYKVTQRITTSVIPLEASIST